MGFNIGGLLSGIGGLVSTVFGNKSPAGALIGGGLKIAGAALTPSGSPPGRATIPPTAPIVLATSTAPAPITSFPRRQATSFFGPTNIASLSPLAGAGARAIGGAGVVAGVMSLFGGNGESVSDILKLAREETGRSVTKNKIIDAAKACGIELAANTFGISESQVCIVIVAGRSRRSRGISAADIRRTRRVIRFNKGLTKQLKVR